MRLNIFQVLIVLLGIVIGIIASISIPWVQAEDKVPCAALYAYGPLLNSTEINVAWNANLFSLQRVNNKENLPCAQSNNPKPIVYGTGSLDKKDDYLIGVKVSFTLSKWADLTKAIARAFGWNSKTETTATAHLSLIFDRPDY